MSEAFDRLKERVVALVAAIPEGRVTTYGLLARHLHVGPRQVARVLVTLTPAESAALPWFRVVAANGVVSSFAAGVGRKQVQKLRAEGVAVTPSHRVEDFRVAVWTPTPPPPPSAEVSRRALPMPAATGTRSARSRSAGRRPPTS